MLPAIALPAAKSTAPAPLEYGKDAGPKLGALHLGKPDRGYISEGAKSPTPHYPKRQSYTNSILSPGNLPALRVTVLIP